MASAISAEVEAEAAEEEKEEEEEEEEEAEEEAEEEEKKTKKIKMQTILTTLQPLQLLPAPVPRVQDVVQNCNSTVFDNSYGVPNFQISCSYWGAVVHMGPLLQDRVRFAACCFVLFE